MLTVIRKYQNILASIGLTILAFYLRFKNYSHNRLIGDEFIQVLSSDRSFKPFWKWNFYCDVTTFPGDYLLTYPILKIFGHNVWAFRVPRVIIAAIGFYFLYLVAKRYYRTTVGYLVAFGIACFNATLIGHAFEIRPYSVLPTFYLMSFYFMHKIINERDSLSSWQKFLLALFFFIVAGYHIYGLFIISIPAFYFLLEYLSKNTFQRLWREKGKYLCLIGVLSFAVWFYYALGSQVKLSGNMQFFGTDNHTFYHIPNPLLDIVGFLKAIVGNLVGKKQLYVLLLGLINIFIVPRKQKFEHLGFVLILVVLPLEILLHASLVKNYLFIQRQFIWVIPFFALFLGWQWDCLTVRLLDFIKVKKKK